MLVVCIYLNHYNGFILQHFYSRASLLMIIKMSKGVMVFFFKLRAFINVCHSTIKFIIIFQLLLDISTLKPNRHLKLSFSDTELLILAFSHKPHLKLSLSHIVTILFFQLLKPDIKHLEVIFDLFPFLNPIYKLPGQLRSEPKSHVREAMFTIWREDIFSSTQTLAQIFKPPCILLLVQSSEGSNLR